MGSVVGNSLCAHATSLVILRETWDIRYSVPINRLGSKQSAVCLNSAIPIIPSDWRKLDLKYGPQYKRDVRYCHNAYSGVLIDETCERCIVAFLMCAARLHTAFRPVRGKVHGTLFD